MYRKVDDFLTEWEKASSDTIQVLEAITDEKLTQAIVEDHSTLGWLGWHLTTSIPFFAGQAGLIVDLQADPKNVPNKAATIVDTYKRASQLLVQAIKEKLTDDTIVEQVECLGQQMPRGAVLRIFVDHQTHHRGQMTVLLRQAGLNVPGIMGPTKEDQGK